MADLSFIIFSLPRSRSYWLSQYLSYGGIKVEHDDWEGLNYRSWFSGTVETGLVPYWRDIKSIYPKSKMAVVERPIGQIMASLMKVDSDIDYDLAQSAIESASHHMKELITTYPDTLSTSYNELSTEAGCKKIFEFCLNKPHDHQWYMYMKDRNLQRWTKDQAVYG